MNRRTILRHALGLLLVVGVAGMVYVAVTPSQSATEYSELYLLNESGVAADYPTELSVGENATVIVGVGNRRSTVTTYTVAVTLGDREITHYTLSVEPGTTAERPVTFTANEEGTHELRVRLYRGSEVTETPLLTVGITVQVRSPDASPTSTASTPTPTASPPSTSGSTSPAPSVRTANAPSQSRNTG